LSHCTLENNEQKLAHTQPAAGPFVKFYKFCSNESDKRRGALFVVFESAESGLPGHEAIDYVTSQGRVARWHRYFETKNPNLGKFMRIWQMEDVGIFNGHFIYFTAIWYIL
jgi:hypothetical protein